MKELALIRSQRLQVFLFNFVAYQFQKANGLTFSSLIVQEEIHNNSKKYDLVYPQALLSVANLTQQKLNLMNAALVHMSQFVESL